jgi:molecular chaperone GrpE
MVETTDGKLMEEQNRQESQGVETSEHHGRGRRREQTSGKHGPASGPLVEPILSEAQEAAVQQRLVEEQAKAEDAVQRLARSQADFANYKRRNEQEREQQARFANLMLVSDMLEILDNLDRAMATVPEAVSSEPWMEGLILVDRQLRGTLEKHGLQAIAALGTKFDPMLHEAIIHEESTEHPDDEVMAELRRGYMLHDRVVRPTLVKVAKHVEQATEPSEGN